MKKKKLEQKVGRFTQVGTFEHLEIFASGIDRILYDRKKKEVFMKYEEGDDVHRYITRHNQQKKRVGDDT